MYNHPISPGLVYRGRGFIFGKIRMTMDKKFYQKLSAEQISSFREYLKMDEREAFVELPIPQSPKIKEILHNLIS